MSCLVRCHTFWEWATCFVTQQSIAERAYHYRYFSGPSIIVAHQRRGMLRWAWLKSRIPPDLFQRKWEGREPSSPRSIHLHTALFMCYLVHWLLLHTPSPLLEFYNGCWWIEHVSFYVPQYLVLTALLCADVCAWKGCRQPANIQNIPLPINMKNVAIESVIYS